MKKFMIPGAAAVATAALSLLLGGGVANAQEVAEVPAPVQVPAIHAVDALGSAIKDAPQSPAVPASDVLSFLSDSINLLGRDILSAKGLSAKGLSALVTTENPPVDPQDPNAQSEDEGVMVVIGQVAPYSLALLGIPALAIPGGVVGAVAGAVVGAGVAIFAGIAAAVIVASPALIAGLGTALVPALAIAAVGVVIGLIPALVLLVAGVVAIVSAIVVGLMVITWPLWVVGGLVMLLIGLGIIPIGTGAAIATGGVATPIAIAGIVFMVLGLLPGIALVVAGLLFGVAAVVALLTLPLVGLAGLILSVAAFVFLGVMALIGSLGLLPAIVAFVVFGLIAAVVTIPVGAVIGLAAGGVIGAVAGAVGALIYVFVIAPRKKKDEEAPADDANAPKEKKMAVQADYALAA
ncbi:hypothetical protein [Lawsonella clevelandensis]|uniref:hypothetical protein n=1 Tax=Lawsonella clevelandensis TaxID=1528099 RepID=UPI0023F17465|nr:hypothetical protein [Lawsonella clevelandensis]